jgi:beta-glucosidase
MDIINRTVSSGTPTVVIMVAGRPMTGLESELSKWNAFMMAWLPGTEGKGVADVLFGDVDASGRLSQSWPKTIWQEPINYDARPGESYDPLYEFGYGLSYTNFTYSDLSVTPSSVYPTGNVTISVNVTNTGSRSGREVVQVYLRDLNSTLSTPIRKLYRAEKTPTLGAGENTTVRFSIPVSELGYYTDTKDKVLESGNFTVMVGGLNASFEVAAPAPTSVVYSSSPENARYWDYTTKECLNRTGVQVEAIPDLLEVDYDSWSRICGNPITFIASPLERSDIANIPAIGLPACFCLYAEERWVMPFDDNVAGTQVDSTFPSISLSLE